MNYVFRVSQRVTLMSEVSATRLAELSVVNQFNYMVGLCVDEFSSVLIEIYENCRIYTGRIVGVSGVKNFNLFRSYVL